MMTGKDWKKACCPETRAVVHCGACSVMERAMQCFLPNDEPGAWHDAAGMKAAWKKSSATVPSAVALPGFPIQTTNR
jgi:Ni,Fe-hydrogenase III small subunit